MNKNILAPLEWSTVKRKVNELVPYNYNPRTIDDADRVKLQNSLEKFNLVEIPVIDMDNILIAGHQRIVVLMELHRGDEVIDVRIPNRKLTEDEFKEYNLRSNISNGEFDFEKIDEHFANVDLEDIGFEIGDFNQFIEDRNLQNMEDENDFEPELPKEPISKESDVYEFYSKQKGLYHRVICGDSTLSDTYKKLLVNKKFDLVVTDPYNVNYEGGTKEKLKIKNDQMSNDEFFSFLFLFYQETFINSNLGAPIYVFHADSEGANFRNALTQSGYKLSQCLVWVKNSIVLGRQDYHWKHEPILYGWKEGAAHPWYSDRKQSTVVNFDKPVRNAEHPTMKPLDLVSYFVKNSSKQKDIVGDMFLGSGSTLISCENTWRNCYGVEFDPKYVDVIVTRWIKYMLDNHLEFVVKRNGVKLTSEELESFTVPA